MLTYKYIPPEKITTDYFYLKPVILGENYWTGFIEGGREVRKVAAKGANGLYAVRSGVIDSIDEKNHRPNPFTFWTGLKDRFILATDYTKTFEQALKELRDFQDQHIISAKLTQRPDDAVRIARIPVLRSGTESDAAWSNSVNPYGPISLPGKHIAM